MMRKARPSFSQLARSSHSMVRQRVAVARTSPTPDVRVKAVAAQDICSLAVVWRKNSRDAGMAMWKQLWRKWTVEKPAAFGDLLWEVLVVQFAAWLDRLTVRQVIAFIPVAALIVAYLHHVPVHPGLMLMGDLLAYIDIFSMIFLLGVLSRVTTVLFVAKQAAAGALRLLHSGLARLQRLDVRHRREGGAPTRKRPARRARDEDDIGAIAGGAAWA
jgi:hypothetical protein